MVLSLSPSARSFAVHSSSALIDFHACAHRGCYNKISTSKASSLERDAMLRAPFTQAMFAPVSSHPLSPLLPPPLSSSLLLLLSEAPLGSDTRCIAVTLLRHSGQLYCGSARQCERRQ